MWDLIFEYGMPTVSWYAELALRRRVSMSAIGSVIDMAALAFLAAVSVVPDGPSARRVLPAGLRDAGQFAAVRHRAEADTAQAELAIDGTRAATAGAPRVSPDFELRLAVRLDDQRLLSHLLAPPPRTRSGAGLLARLHGHGARVGEREPEAPQQRPALVVGRGRGDEGYVHPPLPVYLVRVDLVEHDLLGEAEGVVPVAVELPGVQATEVTDARQRDREQPVEELPHPVAAQRHVGTDRHALAQLELGDGLLGPRHGRLLPGDRRQVPEGAIDQLRVPGRLADAHVHEDLGKPRDLHHVGVPELVLERRSDLGAVLLLEPGPRRCLGRHQISFPLGRRTRTFVPSSLIL